MFANSYITSGMFTSQTERSQTVHEHSCNIGNVRAQTCTCRANVSLFQKRITINATVIPLQLTEMQTYIIDYPQIAQTGMVVAFEAPPHAMTLEAKSPTAWFYATQMNDTLEVVVEPQRGARQG